MDVWGDDPWADNATSPGARKDRGAPVLPTTDAILGGFEDEAGWGDFETTGGNGWANEGWGDDFGQAGDEKDDSQLDPLNAAASHAGKERGNGESLKEDSKEYTETFHEDIVHDFAFDDTDTSPHDRADESSTQSGSTVVPDAAVTEYKQEVHISKDEGNRTEEDEQHRHRSKRPLSSSSEATDISEIRTVSSARTSFDQGSPVVHSQEADHDEQASKDSSPPQQTHLSAEGDGTKRYCIKEHRVREESTGEDTEEDAEKEEAEEEDAEEEDVEEEDAEEEEDTEEAESTEEDDTEVQRTTLAAATTVPKAKAQSGFDFEVDVELLNKLFKPRSKPDKPEQSVEDLIDATSTRKTWYRLTRSQTLRGFLSGDLDDSYVRVGWLSSQVRKEATKIVSRWASEDRFSGRTVFGGTPKTAFGWDEPSPNITSLAAKRKSVSSTQPSPASARVPHSRQTSLSTKSLAPSPVAQFGWSTSPLASTFPDRDKEVPAPSPTINSTENPWRRSMPTRPSSLHISSTSIDAVFSGSLDSTTPSQIPPTSPKLPSTAAAGGGGTISAKTGLSINTSIIMPEPTIFTEDEDDDDEWGEMVQSPPPPDSPAVIPSATTAATSPACFEPREEIILTTQKTRKPSPISATQFKPAIPDGPLSPSRRAAFNAARVTRTLSSQQPAEDALLRKDETHPEDFTKIKLRKVSPKIEPEIPAQDVAASTNEVQVPTESLRVDFSNEDLSLFDSMQSDRNTINSTKERPKSEKVASGIPILTSNDAQRVRNLLAQMPDLSYMFK